MGEANHLSPEKRRPLPSCNQRETDVTLAEGSERCHHAAFEDGAGGHDSTDAAVSRSCKREGNGFPLEPPGRNITLQTPPFLSSDT